MTSQPQRAVRHLPPTIPPSRSRHLERLLKLRGQIPAAIALICFIGGIVLGSVVPGPFRYLAVAVGAVFVSLPWLYVLIRRHGLAVLLPVLAGIGFSITRLVMSGGNVISATASDASRYVSNGEAIASAGGTSITSLLSTASPADRIDQLVAMLVAWLGGGDTMIFLFFGATTGIAVTTFLSTHLASSKSHARWPFVLVCCVPSILLWSAAPSKESIVMIGLAAASIATTTRSILGRITFGLVAMFGLWLARPGYVPLILIASVVAYLWRPTDNARSMHFRQATGAAFILSFVVISVLAPSVLFGNLLGESNTGDSLGAVLTDRSGRTDIGGSAISTAGGPVAAFGSLIRPFPWDVGLVGTVIFVEFLVVLALVLINAFRAGRGMSFGLPPTTLGRFSLALGLLLWLATLGFANLGIISRLRSMAYLPALGALITYAAGRSSKTPVQLVDPAERVSGNSSVKE